MKLFKVVYRLHSTVASDWQADTIFGHLCWALLYLEGEDVLKQFLKEYEQGRPPLIISNGFPSDLLPRPITPPNLVFSQGNIEQQREVFNTNKSVKNINLLSPVEFYQAIQGNIVIPRPEGKHYPQEWVTLKNQINRLTGTTSEGGTLYDFQYTVWKQKIDKVITELPVTIYVKVRDDTEEERAQRLFSFIAEQGYGKRKSVGYGQIESCTFEPIDGFGSPPDANGFVTLSNFVPAKSDPTHGTWQIIVKYGKLGEANAISGSPFKRPLLMLTAGSTFHDAPCSEYYGRMVRDVANPHLYPDVVQYALAFPVPMKIKE